MKTKDLLLYGVVAFALLSTSCEKGSGGEPRVDPIITDSVIDEPIIPVDTLTVEEHKTNIESAGFEMMDEMKAMETEPAIETDIAFVGFLTTAEPFKSSGSSVHPSKSLLFAPVYATANYKQSGIKGLVKSVAINPAEEPSSIQEVYDMLVGIYEWNADYQEWSYTDTGDKIVFLFPSTENGTSNNASYTVSYVGYNGPNPIKDDPEFGYEGDLPQNISAKLVVDATEISAYLLDIVYSSEGIPTSINTSLSMGSYKLSAMAANANDKQFDTEIAFTNGDKILLKFVLGASGDWTEDNIDANYSEETKYYYGYWDDTTGEWVEVEVGENDNWDYYETEVEFDIHKVIKQGNASFQAMNLKVVGQVDIEKLGDAVKNMSDTLSDEGEINKAVEILNQNISLSLRYVDSDKIIALVEAYPILREETLQNWVYNENTGNWDMVEYTETYYDIALRFVFGDGSKVDAETYFADNFNDLQNSLEDWANELENTYGK